MPATCHSTKWSSCTEITQCAINLSQSVLWEIKKQQQVSMRFCFPGVNPANGREREAGKDQGDQGRWME